MLVLNKYFCSTTNLVDENKTLPDFDDRWGSVLENIWVREEIIDIISILDSNKGTTIKLERGGRGYVFFLKKIFWFPMLLKIIFWFWWRKKKYSNSEFLSYNLMLNSGKKIRASRNNKKYSNSCVVRKKISGRNKKP